MLRATLFGTVVLMTISGCSILSDIPLNPLDWFGSSEEETAQAEGETEVATVTPRPLVDRSNTPAVVDGRALVQSVEGLTVDQTTTGAIVRANGIAPAQGYFNAQLVNAGVENGVLTLEFRAQAPAGTPQQGSPRSRRIDAAYVIDNPDLLAIRSIRVQSATNARASAR